MFSEFTDVQSQWAARCLGAIAASPLKSSANPTLLIMELVSKSSPTSSDDSKYVFYYYYIYFFVNCCLEVWKEHSCYVYPLWRSFSQWLVNLKKIVLICVLYTHRNSNNCCCIFIKYCECLWMCYWYIQEKHHYNIFAIIY
jgi:hypothetical protein